MRRCENLWTRMIYKKVAVPVNGAAFLTGGEKNGL